MVVTGRGGRRTPLRRPQARVEDEPTLETDEHDGKTTWRDEGR